MEQRAVCRGHKIVRRGHEVLGRGYGVEDKEYRRMGRGHNFFKNQCGLT
jgi:hypothetical protein